MGGGRGAPFVPSTTLAATGGKARGIAVSRPPVVASACWEARGGGEDVCGARFVDCVCVMSWCVREPYARIAGACGMELRAQNAGFKGSERHPHMAFPAIHSKSFDPNIHGCAGVTKSDTCKAVRCYRHRHFDERMESFVCFSVIKDSTERTRRQSDT